MYILCVHVEWIGSTGPIIIANRAELPSDELPTPWEYPLPRSGPLSCGWKSADLGREIEAGQTLL